MKEITISIEDLPERNSEKNKYGISGIYRQLYEFFKMYPSNGTIYHIDKSSDNDYFIDKMFMESENIYKRFGIYTGSGVINNDYNCFIIIPREIIYNGEQSVQDFIYEKITLDGEETKMHVGAIVLEMEKEEQQRFIQKLYECGEDNFLLTLKLQYNILNIGFLTADINDTEEELRKNPAFKGYNFSNLFVFCERSGCVELSLDVNVIIKKTRAVIDEIVKYNFDNPNTIFYWNTKISGVSPDMVKLIEERKFYLDMQYFVTLAATLTCLYDIRVVIPESVEKSFEAVVQGFATRHRNYLKDYLEYLKDPLRIGFKATGNIGFLYTRSEQKTDGTIIRVTYLPIEEANIHDTPLTRVRSEIKEFEIDVRQIVMRDVTDFYDLHTLDYNKGILELNKLQLFMNGVQEAIGLEDVSLDVTNTLFFELDNQLYVGYVSRINANATYNVQCLAKGFRNSDIKDTLDTRGIDYLLDMRVCTDYFILVNGNAMKKLSRKYNDKTIGVLAATLSSISTTPIITPTSTLEFDSVCLWSPMTSLIRGLGVNSLINTGLPLKGLRREFLTFFGGPAPYTSDGNKPTLIINEKLWS